MSLARERDSPGWSATRRGASSRGIASKRRSSPGLALILLELGDTVDALFHVLGRQGVAEAVFHEEGVFAGVAVEAAENADRLELLAAEEELGAEIGLADLERDPGAAVARELADQLG